MHKKEKATGANCGSSTFDYLTGNQRLFVSDYEGKQAELQRNILAAIKPAKVTRLHRCFGCEGSFTQKKMSAALVVCKECFIAATADDKGKTARNNFVEKTLNNFHKFLRRRVAV